MKLFYKIFILFGFTFLLYSCYDTLTESPVENQPPKTFLYLMPDSTISQQQSKIRVHWWGDDPDGLVIGYFFSWDGVNWTFTTKNDSTFALQIGDSDTIYTFRVSAVDNGGNGLYEPEIIRNGINYGPGPFIDANNNGVWDNGEFFYDIGLIDAKPAMINLPIKNSPPVIEWTDFSFLPDTSFPAMTFGWNATDIDGDETISAIQIALNDTSEFISLPGNIRVITLRTKEFDSPNPMMEILLNSNELTIFHTKLTGLKLDDNNKFYVRAVDISNAKSNLITLPSADKTWYVKKPKGDLIVVNDYAVQDMSHNFYRAMFDSLSNGNMKGNYDIWNLHRIKPPFLNVTFLETIKLFKFVFWYTDNSPSLDLASLSTLKYLEAGGKIFFSLQFPQFFNVEELQGFLPVDTLYYRPSIPGNTIVKADSINNQYPQLRSSLSVFRVRSFYPNPLSTIPVYYYPNKEMPGYTGFKNAEKTMFFLSLPLHLMNGGEANVKKLLERVLFTDFGLTL